MILNFGNLLRIKMKTRKEALNTMRAYTNKSRSLLPWLKKRPNMSDCVAGYSYCATGKITKYIWVREMVALMKKNGTWRKGTPKPGDAIIYSWKANGTYDHVAMFHSKNKLGQWVAYGANQSKTKKVTRIATSKRVIVGWGTPFKYSEEVDVK